MLKSSFEAFLKKPKSYKQEFLQVHYNIGFDGYSYMGQKSSINQYDTDLLYSFVLSEFSKKQQFPAEFHVFLNNEWQDLVSKIRSVELELIDALEIEGLKDFYNDSIGHMVSCNYYPKLNPNISKDSIRLSKHMDVSLFTVFIFGIDEGFSFQNFKNQKQPLASMDNVLIFPGYLLEFLSNGKYKALEHQVDFLNENKERFSFAFFSLPKPNQDLKFADKEFTSEWYFKNYLSLF